MNKLLVGSFYSIALSLTGNFSPAPELVERAKGYAHKQVQSKIRYEDGIDRAEAFAYAEWQILGMIDYNRLPVQRYDLPQKDGDFWRINVFVKTSNGLKNRPILVDSVTGASRGEDVQVDWRDSWFNHGGGSVNLGSSHYRIERGKVANTFLVEVMLNRDTKSNDLAARRQCYRDAVRAIAKIKQGFPAKFEDVPLRSIVMSEALMADTRNPSLDRKWFATFPLTQKRSVTSHKP